MAEDAIDKALAGGRLSAAGPCRTKELPLMGAQGYTPALFTDVAQHYRVPHRPGAIDTRVARYLAGEPCSAAESYASCDERKLTRSSHVETVLGQTSHAEDTILHHAVRSCSRQSCNSI